MWRTICTGSNSVGMGGGGGRGLGGMLHVYAAALLVIAAVHTSLALPPFHIRSDPAARPSEAALDWMQHLHQARLKRFPPFHMKRSSPWVQQIVTADADAIEDRRDNLEYLTRSLHRLVQDRPMADDSYSYLNRPQAYLLQSDISGLPSRNWYDPEDDR